MKKLPNEIIEHYNNIKWNEIAKLRDILIHYYYGADEKMIWDITKKDIPILEKNIIVILDKYLLNLKDAELKNKLIIKYNFIKSI